MLELRRLLSCALVILWCSILCECCRYKYLAKRDPSKIRLCVSSRYVPWKNETVRGMIHENTTVFCSRKSQVNKYFSLSDLRIPGAYKRIQVSLIEKSCDMVISVTNGRFTHEAYNKTKDFPLVLAVPNNTDILLTWSDKMKWKKWMISNGFGKYVPKSVNFERNPSFPFIMKEGLSENTQGVSVIQNDAELKAKLKYFKEKKITNYYGEEALTGMGRAQGIFYISAFQGKVLSIQCNLQVGIKSEIHKQNFSNNIFLAGRPPKKPPIRGFVNRVAYDDEISNTIHRITYQAQYTGVYCAEFKMNNLRQIVFMEFNARICFQITQQDQYFLEAYLPLAFAIHQHIRTMKTKSKALSDRISSIVLSTKQWYNDQTLQNITHGYQLHSPGSRNLHSKLLPTMWEMMDKSGAFLW